MIHNKVVIHNTDGTETIVKCPLCKSENVADESIYQSNGILGPGHSSWRTKELLVCEDCGIYFKTINKNKPQTGEIYE